MTKLAPQSTDKEHALCGASNSSRWLGCPGSIAMGLKVPEPPQSEYAAEGQRAHDLGEIYLRLLADHYHKTGKDLRKTTDIREFATKEDYPIEMREHCWDYACVVMDEVLKRKPKKVLIEQKVILHQGYGMFGTADCFFGYKDKNEKIHLAIYDLKYGKGVVVEADSPQLIYYALAVAETFKLTPDVYHLNIFQPRADHSDGQHRTYIMK